MHSATSKSFFFWNFIYAQNVIHILQLYVYSETIMHLGALLTNSFNAEGEGKRIQNPTDKVPMQLDANQ